MTDFYDDDYDIDDEYDEEEDEDEEAADDTDDSGTGKVRSSHQGFGSGYAFLSSKKTDISKNIKP